MLNQKSHHTPRPKSAKKPLLSPSAMAFAKKVAAEFKELETGYRNGLYKFFGSALTSYRKFLKDEDDYKELLSLDIISSLREKPNLKETSRLVLYYLTNARSTAERNTAGKYARIVDYLYKESVQSAAAADHMRALGGMDAVLKKARGREALKVSNEALQEDDRDFEQAEEADQTSTPNSASEGEYSDLFDPEQDLSIRVKPETRERILGSEIGVHRSFYLKCRKKEPVGPDGIRIIGRLVKAPESP